MILIRCWSAWPPVASVLASVSDVLPLKTPHRALNATTRALVFFTSTPLRLPLPLSLVSELLDDHHSARRHAAIAAARADALQRNSRHF